MDSVINFDKPAGNLVARGQLAPVGEFWGKALAAVGTTCSEDLPFKIPRSGTDCPSVWQLGQGIGVWELTPYSRVSCTSVYSQKLHFLSVWGFFSGISQFVLYLSGIPWWREKRVFGLLPDL